MRIVLIHYPLTTLGPGVRVGFWTTGCNKNCKNCMTPQFQKYDKKAEMSVYNIIFELDQITKGKTKRITISGGEPFDNVDFKEFLEELKENGYEDILVYTGYTKEEIEENDEWKECLKYIDVVVFGRYIDELNNNDALKGSSNQEIVILNKTLKNKYKEYLKLGRQIETEIYGDKLMVFGIPKNKRGDD